ncbi:uncharacterized protein TM35_000092690 [Trypanosoma theileri]|uniref:Uncharacterized protein n=1 Tax=Trypanosoma theileri TaxID=67003 RepID=A0A1X0P119_9TRYP|nr:uncharacterized protein TM35_000092690 [Trypanosoma theileri]ORC90219.1 hypothetical protein TM35_000092690 [Trypanosoma theileri]
MARGRRPGTSSSSTTAGVGRGGRKTPVENSQSISTPIQPASPVAVNDGGSFAGGRGRGKRGRPSSSQSAAQNQQQPQQQQQQQQQQKSGILTLQRNNPIVSFWKGFCRHDALTQALANIGTMIEAESPLLVSSSQPEYPFSGLSTDRILVAIQAIVDAIALMEFFDNSEENDSLGEKKCQVWETVQNLVRMSEAAVPMKFSALIRTSVVNGVSEMTSTTTSTNISNIPPTTSWTLRDRLRRLKRLWQLHKVHTCILPSLRECKSKSDIVTLFFGNTQDKANTIESMPEITSLHKQEQQLINDLMEEVNDNNLCMESCGTVSFPPLRVSAGSYIIHKRSRFEVLGYLLNVAEFFGLPAFLRYIRVNAERSRSCLDHSPMTYMSFTANNTESHLDGSPSSSLPPLLFPSPCDLDPRCYRVSVPDQIQLVQGELIELANNYCSFGILVGEADQILLLLHTSATCQEGMKTGRGGVAGEGTVGSVKLEQSNGNPLPNVGKEKLKSDPLLSYARLFIPTANKGDTKKKSVYWLCDNRWNCSMKYYALVLAVVVPQNDLCENEEVEEVVEVGEQKGCEEAKIKKGEKSSGGSVNTIVPYYVAAVLELSRS